MNSVTALDHRRRCMFCGAKIFLCNGFVLARDMVPIMQAILEDRPIQLPIKVRELCGRCDGTTWGPIAQRYEQEFGELVESG
jgi:hypothetical protein